MASTTIPAAPAPRQRSLLEFGKEPVELHVCPCCLNKTSREPGDIIAEVEAARARKEQDRAARAHARRLVQIETDRLFMETHVQVPKQSAKTGKWRGTEWIPKEMLATSWRIPSHAFTRIVDTFRFDKAAGCDLMTFRVKSTRTAWRVDQQAGSTRLETAAELFTLWDLLASAFTHGPARH
ncbi:MAG: hypothetical protein GYA24_24450 [Candidatus Lokiarchaeota archaeon]|nr:hypothetical protein [Candidatus Lokiarchaeota archaeon]